MLQPHLREITRSSIVNISSLSSTIKSFCDVAGYSGIIQTSDGLRRAGKKVSMKLYARICISVQHPAMKIQPAFGSCLRRKGKKIFKKILHVILTTPKTHSPSGLYPCAWGALANVWIAREGLPREYDQARTRSSWLRCPSKWPGRPEHYNTILAHLFTGASKSMKGGRSSLIHDKRQLEQFHASTSVTAARFQGRDYVKRHIHD